MKNTREMFMPSVIIGKNHLISYNLCSNLYSKCKKAKWLSGEALQIAVKRREAKAKEKRKDRSI